MSDQESGQSENGAKPGGGADPLSSRARTAPVIEGEAAEVPASATSEPASAEAPSIEAPSAEPPQAQEPPPEEPKPENPQPENPNAPPAGKPGKNYALRLLAATACACVLGGAGYFGWTEWASREAAREKVEVAAMAPSHVVPAPVSPSVVATVVAPAVFASPVEPPAADVPKTDTPKADLPKAVEAPPEPEPTAPLKSDAAGANPVGAAPVAANPVEAKPAEANPVEAPPEPVTKAVAEPETEKALAEVTARLAATQAALDQVTEKLHAAEARAVEERPEPVMGPAAAPETEKALAEVTARLAASQAELEQVTAKLRAAEGQLAAPKTESRVLPTEREAGPSGAGAVSARIIAAQSLLTAIRQGDDYAPLLTALQNLGGDPDRIARLRAGLSAPNAEGLAKDFAALKPKILAAAAAATAAPPPPHQEKAPQNVGETVLNFLQNRTEKLVRIRPAGAPDADETVSRVGRIDKDLARGDIAAALAERAQLPAPALALTSSWAASAQAHLDAELAARAELAAALQDLSKSKS